MSKERQLKKDDIGTLIKLHRAGLSYAEIGEYYGVSRGYISTLLGPFSPKTDCGIEADIIKDKYDFLRLYLGDIPETPMVRRRTKRRYSQRYCKACGCILEHTRAIYCYGCTLARRRVRNKKAYQARLAKRRAGIINAETRKLNATMPNPIEWRHIVRFDDDIKDFLKGIVTQAGVEKVAKYFGTTTEHWLNLAKEIDDE